MLIFHFAILTILTGWWLGTTEVPAGFSGLAATGALRRQYLGWSIIGLVVIGGCLLAMPLSRTFAEGAQLTTPVSALIISVSGSAAMLGTHKLSGYSSVCYGIMGAVLGWKFFLGAGNLAETLSLFASWLIVPVLAGLLSAAFYMVYRFFILKTNIHILLLIRYLRVGLLVAAACFALFVGMNNGALIMMLNDSISPGFAFSWNGIDIGEDIILFVFAVLLIALVTWQKSIRKIRDMAEGEFDANIESVLITLVSGALVLLFFSLPAVCGVFGLSATPVSLAGVVVGGFAGINLVKKGEGTEYQSEARMMLATLATPVVGFLICYFVLNIVDIQSLQANGLIAAVHPRGNINITPVITVALLLAFITFIIVYLRKQRRIRMQAEITLLENQNKLFENQKAMSALEVKTVITENERLNAQLELRRKELINIALSITEQKNFQESLYQDIKSLRELDDPAEIKRGIESLEKQLVQKMNFSQEIESFYAQIESLHKDFNIRLTEKHPNLTEQERRLTTLLRLGFSSKHIAALMNISPKSVEMSRYRLRNRLGLDHDQKLINFIKNI